MKIVLEKQDLIEVFTQYLNSRGVDTHGKTMSISVHGARRGNKDAATATIELTPVSQPDYSPNLPLDV
jgi:hypothetical protein